MPCALGLAPRLSSATSSSTRFGRRTSQSKLTYRSGTKLGWRHKSTRHSSATLRDSEDPAAVAAAVAAPAADPPAAERAPACGCGVSASGRSAMRRNASSCILSSEGITMYSCRMVAAVAASTGARPRGATASMARLRSSRTSRSSAGCLVKSSPADSSDASTSCRPNAHTLSACSSAPSSSDTNDTEKRKISSTHARPKGASSVSRTRSSSRAVAVASSVASPETRPAPFVGDRGGRSSSGGDEEVAAPSSPPAPRGAATEASMRAALSSPSAGRCGSLPNAACTISRSTCLERLRSSALSLPDWCPMR